MAQTWDVEVDLVVFGSGAAGLTAALVAAEEGLAVLLCEKAPVLGGTSARSGGTVWIPGSKVTQAAAIADPSTRVRTYLDGELGGFQRRELVDAFLEAGPLAVDYLTKHTQVEFDLAGTPDYHSDRPGGVIRGRALIVRPFDGRRLGKAFSLLRPPLGIHMVLGGMMVGRHEVPQLLAPFESWSAFFHVVSVLSRHLRDRLTHRRGTRLQIGNAMVARYVASLIERNVPMWLNCRLLELVEEEGVVRGAVVEVQGARKRIGARRGVVLATGGIARSPQLQRELMREHPPSYSLTTEENTGDGVLAARQIGAVVDTCMSSPGFWSPASVLKNANGSETVWIHGHMDRAKPGLIAVNSAARRFVNESDSYHDVVIAMFESNKTVPSIPAYLICDHRFIRAYGFGMVRPQLGRISRYVKAGYLKRADTIPGLATAIGVDADQLQRTVDEHNGYARSGVDYSFGRGGTAFNRYNGDSNNKLNPCLAAIERGPFYAIAVYPCTIGTTIGLKTDPDARVLRGDGTAFEGLYACGNDMASVMGGTYPGPGVTIGPGLVFGYKAAMDAAHRPVASGVASTS